MTTTRELKPTIDDFIRRKNHIGVHTAPHCNHDAWCFLEPIVQSSFSRTAFPSSPIHLSIRDSIYWLNGARLDCYGNYLYESWIWFLSYDTYILVPLSHQPDCLWDPSSWFGSQFERNVKKYDHWKLETSCNTPRLLLYFSWPQWSQRTPLLHNLTRMVGYLWTSRQPLRPTWTRPLRSFRICWKRMPCCPRTTIKSRMN